MFLKYLMLTFAITMGVLSLSAQSTKTIDSLEKKYQSCLDEGVNMLRCAKKFYAEMDSMLNVTYKVLQSKNDSIARYELKISQRKWLRKRDSVFIQIEKKYKSNSSGTAKSDDLMLIIDEKAVYVKERVIELISKL